MAVADETTAQSGVSDFEIDASSWIGATRVLVGLLLLYEVAFGGWHKLNIARCTVSKLAQTYHSEVTISLQ